MGYLLDKLMGRTKQEIGNELGNELGNEPDDEPDDELDKNKVNPLTTLLPAELRRRFDKNGNPREGFDLDGNPISDKTGSGAENRRNRWD